MVTRVEYINILQRFKQEHAGKYGITSIGLFGSVARDEHTEESDVDVVVEAPVMSIFPLEILSLVFAYFSVKHCDIG